MNKKRLKIALDFDGVIAHTGALKRAVAERITGKRIRLSEASGERVRAGQSRITQHEWERVKEQVYFAAGAIDKVRPVPGSIAAIRRSLKEGHSVVVITARIEHMRDEALRWLRARGIEIPVIGVGPGKTKIAHLADCDVFVDDDAARVREAQRVVRRALLFRHSYNDDESGLTSIRSLKDI